MKKLIPALLAAYMSGMAVAPAATITFKVTDSARAPIAGALITVDGSQTATTGPGGSATLDLAASQDAREFTVVKDGYFNTLEKLPAPQGRANAAVAVAVALKPFAPWSSFVTNDFESRDPAKNRVKYHPAEPATRRDAPGWFLNCLGEHEGTVRTYDADNHASSTKGDYLTCDFEGASIRLFTLRSRNSGKARITIDGDAATAKTVDLYANTDTNGDYALAYEKYDLAPGKHTVKLEVLGEKGASAKGTKVYFDFFDTSAYPVFPRLGIGTAAGVTANTTKGVGLAHSLAAIGPGGPASIEEVGFVAVDQSKGRAPTINDIRIKAKLDATRATTFRATASATLFDKHAKYAVTSYAIIGGIVYYSDEPVFLTPAPTIRLERNVLGIQAGQGAISTRAIMLRDPAGLTDLKWKILRQNKYDGTPATGIISIAGNFANGAPARKDAPLKITGLAEGEAVVRCYSAGDPDNTCADCLVTVAKPERNPRLAATPMMGWSTWNYYGRAITKEAMYNDIRNMTKPLPAAGGKSLRDLGYVYFQIDGGWRKNWLAPDGRITPTDNFGGPQGIKQLAAHLHANGMKFGLHMCPGWGDCAGQPMGANGFEKLHLREYVDWGLDYLFVDSCTSEAGRRNDPDPQYMQTLYTKFKYYLDNCGRDIAFVATGLNKGDWGYRLVNAMRVAGDISTRINTSAEGHGRWLDPLDRPKPKNAAAFSGARAAGNLWQKTGQGTRFWAHADAMALGDPGLNLTEQQSMFNMWSITAALLILGGDLDKITDEKEGIVQIVTNEEVIAVNQDPLGKAGHILKAYTNNTGVKNAKSATAALEHPEQNLTVYGRPLHDGSWALVIMNNTEKTQNITVKFADLDYDGSIGGKTKLTAGKYYLRNLNTHQDMGLRTDAFTCNNIPVHGSVMIKVTPQKLNTNHLAQTPEPAGAELRNAPPGRSQRANASPFVCEASPRPAVANPRSASAAEPTRFFPANTQATTQIAPQKPVTRATFVTALARLDGDGVAACQSASSGIPFDDVPPGDPCATAAAWAASLNILACDCGASFRPLDPVTREDMAAALCRFLESKGRDPALRLRPWLGTYADEDIITAYRDVKSLQAAGIMSADADNRFNPGKSVTQTEMTETLAQLVKTLEEPPQPPAL